MGYQIALQSGRILLHLEALEDRLAELADQIAAGRAAECPPGQQVGKAPVATRSLAKSRIPRSGLVVGTPAPAFTLRRVDGGALSLEELRGRNVLLAFVSPGCGPCATLMPRLEHLHREHPQVQVVVSRGEMKTNREQEWRDGLPFPVVLQRHWEVSRQYAMFATPAGYLIDGEGRIAAGPAVGAEPILCLLSQAKVPPNAWTPEAEQAASR